MSTNNPDQAAMFTRLLQQATTEPGTISKAYSAFYGYSLANTLLAWAQCLQRSIEPGPIATFNRWKDLGRHVKRGEHALELIVPRTHKRTIERETDKGIKQDDIAFMTFTCQRRFFVLSQTAGEPHVSAAPVGWDRDRALAALNITEENFSMMDGNVQGYAHGRSIAVSPVAANPYKTTFHELAHVLIGHTAESDMRDDERTPRSLRELEAEATAMLVCAALDLPGIEEARGYIQSWYGAGNPVPESSARRIFKAADATLRAGNTESGAES